MTENEAIKILDTEKHCLKNSTRGLCKINCGECKENIPIAYQEKTYEVAIYALKEIQQYREIGTVEECREAVERQKPKGCNIVKDYFRTYYNCPKCNHNLRVEYNRGSWMGKKSKNCDKCGQAIRWDENLEGMEDERD